MSHHIIVLRSLTYAQRAEHLLERAGIYSTVKKVPQTDSAEGCAYGVLVRNKNLNEAQRVLAQNAVKVQKVIEYNDTGGALL